MRTIWKLLKRVARPEGFEPPTLCLEGRRSFQLSYGRAVSNFSQYKRLRHSLVGDVHRPERNTTGTGLDSLC